MVLGLLIKSLSAVASNLLGGLVIEHSGGVRVGVTALGVAARGCCCCNWIDCEELFVANANSVCCRGVVGTFWNANQGNVLKLVIGCYAFA